MHIIHQFDQDFYDQELRVLVLGYIRPELNYTTVGMLLLMTALSFLCLTFGISTMTEALIQDIQTDIRVAQESLKRPAYSDLQKMLLS